MKIKLVGKPKDAPYLTPGKVYEVDGYRALRMVVIDDEGDELEVGPLESCPHARPAKWEIVE